MSGHVMTCNILPAPSDYKLKEKPRCHVTLRIGVRHLHGASTWLQLKAEMGRQEYLPRYVTSTYAQSTRYHCNFQFNWICAIIKIDQYLIMHLIVSPPYTRREPRSNFGSALILSSTFSYSQETATPYSSIV